MYEEYLGIPVRPEEPKYPANPCEEHPDCMWTWDGFCWICVDCILGD